VPLTYLNRTPIPLSKKLNPIWWFGNDSEQTVDQAPWFMAGKPEWLRRIAWNLRNPLQNFRCYVVGVQDRNYSVHVIHGDPDPNVVQRNDVGQLGWQISKLKFPNGFQLPWASYSGTRITFNAGWQPSGFCEIKLNFTSPSAEKTS
jgi:hypothetical protein